MIIRVGCPVGTVSAGEIGFYNSLHHSFIIFFKSSKATIMCATFLECWEINLYAPYLLKKLCSQLRKEWSSSWTETLISIIRANGTRFFCLFRKLYFNCGATNKVFIYFQTWKKRAKIKFYGFLLKFHFDSKGKKIQQKQNFGCLPFA